MNRHFLCFFSSIHFHNSLFLHFSFAPSNVLNDATASSCILHNQQTPISIKNNITFISDSLFFNRTDPARSTMASTQCLLLAQHHEGHGWTYQVKVHNKKVSFTILFEDLLILFQSCFTVARAAEGSCFPQQNQNR